MQNEHDSRHSDFVIIDNLLPEDQFEKICEVVETLSYRQTTAGISIWGPIGDENPKQGVTCYAWPSESLGLPSGVNLRARNGTPICVYPGGTPLDWAFQALKRHAQNAEQIIGREEHEWAGIICIPYAYGSGTKAPWHTDEEVYTGAFIYYVHRTWQNDWGGELLIEDPHMNSGEETFVVSPVPNRLVLLRGGVPHRVERIALKARNHYRRSLSGFFVTPGHARQMIANLA